MLIEWTGALLSPLFSTKAAEELFGGASRDKAQKKPKISPQFRPPHLHRGKIIRSQQVDWNSAREMIMSGAANRGFHTVLFSLNTWSAY